MTTRRSFFGKAGLGLAALATGPALLSGCSTVSGAHAKKAAACTGYTSGKVPFQLGMAGYTLHKFDLDQSLQMLKQVDVRNLCIKDFHLPLKSNAAEISAFKEKCKRFNVTGYGVGPIYMSSEKEAKDAFEYAKRIGVKVMVAVPFEMATINGKQRRKSSRKLCEYVSKLCETYDIRYAIHNHGPDIPELFPTAKSSYDMVKDLDPRMGLCMDIGHEYRSGADPIASAYLYKDRLFDLHLKNVTENTKRGAATPLPRGKIDLAALVKALCDINYTGMCSLEYERDMSDPIVGIAECIGYFRGLMDSVR